MEIRQLKYFIAVAQTLNFSEAARRLYITQGTLSQQIQQLEYEMGSQLFERSSRSVSLTEAGEELLPLALEVTQASEACLTRMRDLRGALAGTLNLGCLGTFRGMMADAVKEFIRENGGVKVNIVFATEGELVEMLRKKEIDIALTYLTTSDEEDIDAEPLLWTSLHILMRKDHPLAGEPYLSLEQIKDYGIILPGRGMQARRSIERLVGIDTRKLNIKVETNHPEVAMDLLQSTSLIAISTPLPAADRPGITAVKLENDSYQMQCCALRLRSGYCKRSSELFLQLLRDSAKFERIARGM